MWRIIVSIVGVGAIGVGLALVFAGGEPELPAPTESTVDDGRLQLGEGVASRDGGGAEGGEFGEGDAAGEEALRGGVDAEPTTIWAKLTGWENAGVGASDSDASSDDRERGRARASESPSHLAALHDDSTPRQLEEQLAATHEALRQSRALATSAWPGGDPTQEAEVEPVFAAIEPRSSPSRDMLCRSAGEVCGSSADCCAGLACDGGIGGFGSVGSCTSPR